MISAKAPLRSEVSGTSTCNVVCVGSVRVCMCTCTLLVCACVYTCVCVHGSIWIDLAITMHAAMYKDYRWLRSQLQEAQINGSTEQVLCVCVCVCVCVCMCVVDCTSGPLLLSLPSIVWRVIGREKKWSLGVSSTRRRNLQ